MKRVMTPLIVTLVLSCFPALTLVASSDSQPERGARDELQPQRLADLVTLREGQFVLDRFERCSLAQPDERGGGEREVFRVRTHVEAPARGVISRDNLVALSTELLHGMVLDFAGDLLEGMTPLQALMALECTQLSDSTGPFDFAIDVTLPATPDPRDIGTTVRLADLVIQREGKFTFDQLQSCHLVQPEALGGDIEVFRVRTHVEAPAQGVISRDNFVALSTEIVRDLTIGFAGESLEGLTPIDALTALQCRQLSGPTGRVDFDVNITLAGDDLQLEITETALEQEAQHLDTWTRLVLP